MKFILYLKRALFLAAILGCVLLLYFIYRSPQFEEGERYTFYFGESSSAAAAEAKHGWEKLFLPGVKGESAVYSGDCYEELCRKFGAELLFCEKIGETTSYYLRSDRLAGGVSLFGKTVNLQIAVDGERTVVGTPLIFGGW